VHERHDELVSLDVKPDEVGGLAGAVVVDQDVEGLFCA
jgi:hypothetical protein